MLLLALSCADGQPALPVGEDTSASTDSAAPPTDLDGDGAPSDVDCDDGDAAIYPGAALFCDGRDHDCDGEPDVDCSVSHADVHLSGDWMFSGRPSIGGDVDGDGRRDLVFGEYAWNDSRGRALLFLGASLATPGSLDAEDADYALFGDQEGAGAGDEVVIVPDVDGDTIDDVAVLSGVGGEEGRVHIVTSALLGDAREVPLADATTTLIGEPGAWWEEGLGTLRQAGDVDGDGLGDLAMTATEPYQVLVFRGADMRPGEVEVAGRATVFETPRGQPWGTTAGDVDGDGLGDLVVACLAADSGNGDQTGAAWLFYGDTLAAGETWSTEDAGVRIDGPEPQARFGTRATSAGDMDQDGLDDLLVGAMMSDCSGRVALYYGHTLGAGPTVSAADFTAAGREDELLSSGAAADDLDGDGRRDLLVAHGSALCGDEKGDTVTPGLTVLPSSRVSFLGTADLQAEGVSWHPTEEYTTLENPAAGDVDGDGAADVLVNNPWGAGGEEAYLLFGR